MQPGFFCQIDRPRRRLLHGSLLWRSLLRWRRGLRRRSGLHHGIVIAKKLGHLARSRTRLAWRRDLRHAWHHWSRATAGRLKAVDTGLLRFLRLKFVSPGPQLRTAASSAGLVTKYAYFVPLYFPVSRMGPGGSGASRRNDSTTQSEVD